MARERITSLRNSCFRDSTAETNSLFHSTHSALDNEEEFGTHHHSIDITFEREGNDTETRTLLDLSPSYSDALTKDITMGEFMDRVSIISTQINLLQSQLGTPTLDPAENRDVRKSGLKTIVTDLEQLSSLKTLTLEQNLEGRCEDKPFPFELSVKLQQISGLDLRLSDALIRLRELAGEELNLIRQEVDNNIKILEIDESMDSLACLDPSESSKLLNKAVRLSRRYPEARQAVLSIEEHLSRVREVEEELKESNHLMQKLMESSNQKDIEKFLTDNQHRSKTEKILDGEVEVEFTEVKKKTFIQRTGGVVLFLVYGK
ncbi:hypothetical protein BY996DRAFT_6408126 [Phakopsora pachyrhizi]|nr:hypothetical protein BY996DRAFT_6408126 [Phakopsora pachyrhizi]